MNPRHLLFLAAFPGSALAYGPQPIDCTTLVMDNEGSIYADTQGQSDFRANFSALATSLSPLHGPVPHAEGHGAIGVDVAIVPPLGCGRLYTGTPGEFEDANGSPVVVRPRVSFAFPAVLGRFLPYGGIGVVPSLNTGGARTFAVSAEFGLSTYLGNVASLGVRGHASLMRATGDIDTDPAADDPEIGQTFFASTTGVDLLVGGVFGGAGLSASPYLGAGVTEATTFAWKSENAEVATNYHPYFGPAFSIGADFLAASRFRFAGEIYAAPGGHNAPWDSDGVAVVDPDRAAFDRYGHLYTARFRLGYEF